MCQEISAFFTRHVQESQSSLIGNYKGIASFEIKINFIFTKMHDEFLLSAKSSEFNVSGKILNIYLFICRDIKKLLVFNYSPISI